MKGNLITTVTITIILLMFIPSISGQQQTQTPTPPTILDVTQNGSICIFYVSGLGPLEHSELYLNSLVRDIPINLVSSSGSVDVLSMTMPKYLRKDNNNQVYIVHNGTLRSNTLTFKFKRVIENISHSRTSGSTILIKGYYLIEDSFTPSNLNISISYTQPQLVSNPATATAVTTNTTYKMVFSISSCYYQVIINYQTYQGYDLLLCDIKGSGIGKDYNVSVIIDNQAPVYSSFSFGPPVITNLIINGSIGTIDGFNFGSYIEYVRINISGNTSYSIVRVDHNVIKFIIPQGSIDKNSFNESSLITVYVGNQESTKNLLEILSIIELTEEPISSASSELPLSSSSTTTTEQPTSSANSESSSLSSPSITDEPTTTSTTSQSPSLKSSSGSSISPSIFSILSFIIVIVMFCYF